jgi:undecaprenyl-diphosphatase
MTDALLSYLRDIDETLFRAINGFCGRNGIFDLFVSIIESPHLKGLAFTSTFGMFWFQRAKGLARQRETLVLLFFAVLISLVLARSLANGLPFRTRPMYTPGIGFREPLFRMDPSLVEWSSFPSDTAAVLFVMTTGFWLLSRYWGLLWACFSIITAVFARVYFGYHYPSEVAAGALIGIGVMIAANTEVMHARIASPILAMEQRVPRIFYALFFPLLFEVATLFAYTRTIRQAIYRYFFG